MAYFHSMWVRNRGGLKRRPMIRVVGETVEEILRVGREYPDCCTINLPPRSKDSWKSKSLPGIWLDADRTDVLEALKSAKVDDNYLRVVTFILREDFYRTKVGMTDEVERFFKTEVRGNVIRLLKEGSWVDHPENQGLKKLNSRLEKLDLGRRSDLKFSSEPHTRIVPKYDRDFKVDREGEIKERQVDEEPEMDWRAIYRDGSKATREEILQDRPWMRAMLVENYGEP